MRDDFFDEGKGRKGISVTVFIVVILLIALLSSTATYFFMPTVKVNEKFPLPTSTPFDFENSKEENKDSDEKEENVSDSIANPNDTETVFTKLYDENCRVVVVLDGYVNQNGQEVKYSQSSGFIISSDGYILTNHHCVEGIDKMMVTLFSGESYVAEIIGSDDRTEVAVLKIDAKEELSVATLGDSDKIKIGQYAIAIGNPVGFEYSMSIGFVSGLERAVDSNNFRYKMIQVDTPLNSGNSGGPLFNAKGEVIGINTMKSSSYTSVVEGIGFAIPINLAKDIASTIINEGKVTRAAIEATVGTHPRGGAVVAEVTKGGAADKAGIKAEDIIVSFNGKKILSVNDLIEQIDYLKPGDTVDITVIRGEEEELKLKITLGSL